MGDNETQGLIGKRAGSRTEVAIHVKAVSKADFRAWVETAKKEFARTIGPAPVRIAETGARERNARERND